MTVARRDCPPIVRGMTGVLGSMASVPTALPTIAAAPAVQIAGELPDPAKRGWGAKITFASRTGVVPASRTDFFSAASLPRNFSRSAIRFVPVTQA
jgi:hypothetical protein